MPRDYQIKNSKCEAVTFIIEKLLEDMKMKTFKDIISSFEQNDINAFETLVRKERALYYPNEGIDSNRSPSSY